MFPVDLPLSPVFPHRPDADLEPTHHDPVLGGTCRISTVFQAGLWPYLLQAAMFGSVHSQS